MTKSEMKEKAIKGVTWSLIERFGIQGIKFVLVIILARLLSPEEFGIIGMITVFFLVAQVFIDSGFGQAYVQKKEVSDTDANTVFYSNLIISVILYLILWIAAPSIASFYEQPILVKLIRVMGIIMIINAFSIIQIAQLTRAVNFKRKSKISLISVTASGLLGVSAAWYGLGVWSLVIQNLSERLFITIGLWFTSKWVPSFSFSRSSFKEMFKYGIWILLGGVLDKIFDNIYVLVIGKLFPIAQLGFYTQAKKFQRLSSQQIAGSIGIVTFPVFSQVQSNIPRLQNVLKKFLQQTLIFMTPLLVIFIVVAKPFVILFLTDKWAPMIPYLQLLCVVGIIYPINMVNAKVLLALGKSKLNFNLSLLKNSLRIINIVVMCRYGVIYIILGEVVLSFISIIINTWFTRKFMDYGLFKQSRDVWKIIVSGAVAGAAGGVLTLYINNLWFLLAAGITLVGGIYLALQYLINRDVLLETIRLKDTFIGRR
ncbi:MAG: lipopolysaccharide biosynthesis protein [Candidatus Marinimicrobia bacterium]|nr:lipopolysaccharide biosynthesis protein [Candidatus Neomarinimicrobiota bacterium]